MLWNGKFETKSNGGLSAPCLWEGLNCSNTVDDVQEHRRNVITGRRASGNLEEDIGQWEQENK
jgi:hypothetical protein